MKINSLILKEDFYNTLTTSNKVVDSYAELIFNPNNTKIYQENTTSIKEGITATNISLFPSYLTPVFRTSSNLQVKKILQKKITGYGVLIKNASDIDTFLKTEYKKSFKSNILRFVTRFNTCFNANYRMFFSEISEEEYYFLMDTLKNMLTERFSQRNDSNKILDNWQFYYKTTLNLIKEKKGSLFVIYHNNTPVHISINHHFDKLLFVSIPSFDINYSKFALGNISLYKILEWAIDNNYEIMDMSYGYLEYKRRWSNHIYEFHHHIIYQKNNIITLFFANIEIYKLKFKNYLKSKNIDESVEKIKNKINKNNNFYNEINYKIENTTTNLITDNLNPLIENSEAFNFIKKPINDFLYTNKEHIDSLAVFVLIKDKEYILKGKIITQKLIIQ